MFFRDVAYAENVRISIYSTQRLLLWVPDDGGQHRHFSNGSVHAKNVCFQELMCRSLHKARSEMLVMGGGQWAHWK